LGAPTADVTMDVSDRLGENVKRAWCTPKEVAQLLGRANP
jgi:hypothetical protein